MTDLIYYRENNNWTVYVHISPNNKYYVGITSQKPERRWRNGKGYKDNKHFCRAIELYGWDSFQHQTVASNLTKDEACKFEIILISELKANDKMYGYNMTAGGDGINGYRHTEEWKESMSKRFSGENSPMYGKKMSKESIEKRLKSINYKGENNPMYGKHHSEETKRKIRLTQLQNKKDVYYRSVEVYQFDKSCNFIKKYNSYQDASIQSGCCSAGNIRHAAENEQLYAGGFIWRKKCDIRIEGDKIYPINLKQQVSRARNIFQFSLQGEYLSTYASGNEIELNFGYKKRTIYSAANGNCQEAYGFLWRYEDDVDLSGDLPTIKTPVDLSTIKKEVYQFTLDYIFVSKYDSIGERGRINNFNSSEISRCANHKSKQAHGFIWRFSEDVEESDIIPGSFILLR